MKASLNHVATLRPKKTRPRNYGTRWLRMRARAITHYKNKIKAYLHVYTLENSNRFSSDLNNIGQILSSVS